MKQGKTIPKATAAANPWRRVGPGTIFALVAAVVVVAWQTSQPADSGGGKIRYEADASGRLQAVGSPSLRSAPPAPPPPLWKPEVHLLLERSEELRLTASQRTGLQTMDTAWNEEKTRLQKQLADASGAADTLVKQAAPEKGGASLAVVRGSLGDYSRLSETYDRRRAGTWRQAEDLLTTTQRQQVNRWESSGSGSRQAQGAKQ